MRKPVRYHVVRKNQADLKALLRALVSGYLLYLGWKLIGSGGSAPSFPPFVACLLGGLLALAGVSFGWFTWQEYRRALKAAELTPEEKAELDREAGRPEEQ